MLQITNYSLCYRLTACLLTYLFIVISLPFIARYRSHELGDIHETKLREFDRIYQSAYELELYKVKSIGKVEKLYNKVAAAAAANSSSVAGVVVDGAVVVAGAAAGDRLRGMVIQQIDAAVDESHIDEVMKEYNDATRSKSKSKLKVAMENSSAVYLIDRWKGCCSNLCRHMDVDRQLHAIDGVVLMASMIFTTNACRDLSRQVLNSQCSFRKTIRSHQWLSMKREGTALPSLFKIHDATIACLVEQLYKLLYPDSKEHSRSYLMSSYLLQHSCLYHIIESIRRSVSQHFIPAIRREWVSELNKSSELEAMDTFSINLKNKLLQPAVRIDSIMPNRAGDCHSIGCPTPHHTSSATCDSQCILSIDPGLASGCKAVVINAHTGDVVCWFRFHVVQCQGTDPSGQFLKHYTEHHPSLVVIGDGKGSIETRSFLSSCLPDANVCLVSESGASIYSASELGMKELPDLSVEYRGAVSIGRRVLDPISEYTKIEPKHLSVGMYQHDIPSKKLDKYLEKVVSESISTVGIDCNTASEAVLQYVPGLHRGTAATIVRHRQLLKRPFRSRKELLAVKGIGRITWSHCIGFLQITASDWTPLDATIVHPDDYSAANAIVRKHTQFQHLYSPNIPLPEDSDVSDRLELYILGLLSQADPRQQRIIPPLPIKKAGAFVCTTSSADQQAQVGAVVRGIVRNITTFGAFINISDCGLTQDGLLHISNYPVGVKDPHHYSVNEEVDVKIMSIKAIDGAVEDRKHQARDKLRITLSAQL